MSYQLQDKKEKLFKYTKHASCAKVFDEIDPQKGITLRRKLSGWVAMTRACGNRLHNACFFISSFTPSREMTVKEWWNEWFALSVLPICYNKIQIVYFYVSAVSSSLHGRRLHHIVHRIYIPIQCTRDHLVQSLSLFCHAAVCSCSPRQLFLDICSSLW